MTKKPKSIQSKPKAKRGTAGEYVESMKVAEAQWKIPVHVLRVAKAAGCPAFSGSRIKRAELEQWLAENPEAKAEGDQAATEAQLRRQKLNNEVTLGNLRIARERKESIAVIDAQTVWAIVVSVVQEEAKMMMDRDEYRTFVIRCKTRIPTIEDLSPQEMIDLIKNFYGLEK